MSEPKVSVIVPIYNVEKYLDKCLRSLQEQTFRDFEVLLIDDGTPDNSMAIAQRFADADPRFLIFHKQNGGLSDARNYGIERATGEFITFVDSDDYVHRDFLKVLYHECADNGADYSYCRFKHSYFRIGLTLPSFISAGKEVMKTRDALNILIKDNYLHSYAWNKMVRRTLFTDHGITFPKMYFEDIATSSRVMYHANKVAITDKYLYYYVKRYGSIMATMDAQKIDDLIRSVLIVRNYIQGQGLYEDYRRSMRGFANKIRLVNIYSIFRQHILHLDFRKLGYNLKTNNRLYRFIVDDNYQWVEGFPELPYRMHQPGWHIDRHT